jgi:hypothetical protein
MRRLKTSRRNRADLLARPPCGLHDYEHGWAALIVDPVEQFEELADLHARGLLSREEFERQTARLLDSWRG